MATAAPPEGARGGEPLVPPSSMWMPPAGSRGPEFTREELIDQGVSGNEASRIVVRATLQQVIEATYSRLAHIWLCSICLVLAGMFAVLAWSQAVYSKHRDDPCDTPLAPMLNVLCFIIAAQGFQREIIRCILCYDLGRDGPVAPCRVRAFKWLSVLAAVGWPVVALAMLSQTRHCSRELVQAVAVIVAYYAVLAFVLVIAPASFISVMLCLVRRGLVRLPRNRAAAPEALIDELPLVAFDAARFNDDGAAGSYPSACPVCLEDFAADRTISLTPCAHVFHTECLRGWLDVARRCPLCRQDLTEQSGTGTPPAEGP